MPTKGYKTRKNKRTDGMIVRRRGKKIGQGRIISATFIEKGPFIDLHLMKKVEAAVEANDRRPIRPGLADPWYPPTWWV